MLKNLIIVLVLIFGFGSITSAAPYFRQDASIVPIDSTENIGTSTNPWAEGHFNRICLTADCKTAWPASGVWPFTPTSYGQATTSVMGFLGGLISNGSTTVPSLGSGLIGANNGLLYGFASSTLFGYVPLNPTRQLTVEGTANQITSSAGAQDLSADRTWTLSLPNNVIFPIAFNSTYGTTTYASSTVLSTSGSAYFATAGGNVGIGTTSPSSKLTIASPNAVTSWDSTQPLVRIENMDNNGTESWALLVKGGANDSATKVFEVQKYDASSLLVVNGDGKIGISSSSPVARLSVKGAGATSATQSLIVTDSANLNLFTIYDNGQVAFKGGTASAPALTFGTDLTSGLYQDTGAVVRVSVGGTRVASFVSAGLQVFGGTGSAGAPNLSIDGGAQTGFFTPASNTLGFTNGGTESARFTSAGLFGIGSTSPSAPLSVESAGSANTAIAIFKTTGVGSDAQVRINGVDEAMLRFEQSGTNNAMIYTDSVSSDLNLRANSGKGVNIWSDGTANRIAILSGGNVGIGTSTPNRKLTSFSTSGPQLSLSSGAGFDEYTFRNSFGTFYLATSTYSATSTVPVLSVDLNGLITMVRGVFTDALRIPYLAVLSLTTDGDIGIDSTSNQFKYYSGAVKVLGDGNFYPAFSYSTSTAWTGTTTIPLGPAYTGETWNGIKCFTDTGTLQVSLNDGTNRMDWLNVSTTVGTVTLTTNNTFTASEKRYVDIGTPASSPTRISCTVSKSLTSD